MRKITLSHTFSRSLPEKYLMRLLKEFTELLKRVPPTLMKSKTSDEQVPQEPEELVIGGQQIGLYQHLHARMLDIKAAHPLNPRPEHQVRHPHLQTIILTVALKYFVIIVKMVLW